MRSGGRKLGSKNYELKARHGNLFRFAPDNIFVIPAVDEAIHFSVGVGMEENPAFDAFAEEEIGSFWEQLLLLFNSSFLPLRSTNKFSPSDVMDRV